MCWGGGGGGWGGGLLTPLFYLQITKRGRLCGLVAQCRLMPGQESQDM